MSRIHHLPVQIAPRLPRLFPGALLFLDRVICYHRLCGFDAILAGADGVCLIRVQPHQIIQICLCGLLHRPLRRGLLPLQPPKLCVVYGVRHGVRVIPDDVLVPGQPLHIRVLLRSILRHLLDAPAGGKFFRVDISTAGGYTVSGSVPPRAIAVLGIRALNFGECFFFHMPDVINNCPLRIQCRGDRDLVIPAVEVSEIRRSVIPAVRRHGAVSGVVVRRIFLSAHGYLCQLVDVGRRIYLSLEGALAHGASVAGVVIRQLPCRVPCQCENVAVLRDKLYILPPAYLPVDIILQLCAPAFRVVAEYHLPVGLHIFSPVSEFPDVILRPPALCSGLRLAQGLFIEILCVDEPPLLRCARQLRRRIPQPVIDALEQIAVLCQHPPDGGLVGEQLLLRELGHKLPGGAVLVQRYPRLGIVFYHRAAQGVHVRAHILRHKPQRRVGELPVQAACLHVVGQLVDQHLPHRIHRCRIDVDHAVLIAALHALLHGLGLHRSAETLGDLCRRLELVPLCLRHLLQRTQPRCALLGVHTVGVHQPGQLGILDAVPHILSIDTLCALWYTGVDIGRTLRRGALGVNLGGGVLLDVGHRVP